MEVGVIFWTLAACGFGGGRSAGRHTKVARQVGGVKWVISLGEAAGEDGAPTTDPLDRMYANPLYRYIGIEGFTRVRVVCLTCHPLRNDLLGKDNIGIHHKQCATQTR